MSQTVPEPPILYQWKTSIPERWVKIKGNSHFQPVTPINHRTLDFLRRTGQYIGNITRPEPTQKSESRFVSRAVSRARKQETIRPVESTGDAGGAKVVTLEYAERKPHRRLPVSVSEKVLREHPRPPLLPKVTPNNYPLKTFLLDPGDTQIFKGYIINKYARPNGLIPISRSKPDDLPSTLQPFEMKRFLGRFDAKPEPDLPPRARKGFNGWKLTRAHLSQTITEETSIRDPLDVTVPDYLCVPYLQWKHSIDDFA